MTNSDDIGPTGITVEPPGNGPDDKPPVVKPEDPPRKLHIRIDRKDYEIDPEELTNGELTGAQIRQRAEPPIGSDRDLFEIVPGGSDRKIENNDKVEIRNGMRFFSAPTTINPGSADPTLAGRDTGACPR